jgi:hypothetical protein
MILTGSWSNGIQCYRDLLKMKQKSSEYRNNAKLNKSTKF